MSETWTINFEPETGGRFTGKLTVDDVNLKFISLYDSSNSVALKSIAAAVGGFVASGGHLLVRLRNDDKDLELMLPKNEIEKTTVRSKMLAKRVVVTMIDGQEFVFNYGMLSVEKLAAAIEA
jgi:hypothetical protein